jgi:hypothetical protein
MINLDIVETQTGRRVEIAYFGACPECHGAPVMHYVWKAHYGVCHTCRTWWPTGYGLLSAWQHMDESAFAETRALLQRYRQVEPDYSYQFVVQEGQ